MLTLIDAESRELSNWSQKLDNVLALDGRHAVSNGVVQMDARIRSIGEIRSRITSNVRRNERTTFNAKQVGGCRAAAVGSISSLQRDNGMPCPLSRSQELMLL